MKKIVSIFLLVTFLLCIAPAVSAAGTAYWSGPDTVRAGDTINLTFYAGGGIYGGSGSVSFDSSVLTLQGYTQAIGGSWAVEFSGNRFVFYDNSMASPISGSSAIFRATFRVNDSVAAGTAISVSATGVTVSDGQQDTGLGSTTYSVTAAAPLSGNCDLQSMTVTGATISPAFSPDTTSYSASVPYSVSSIGVSAEAAHEGAKVSVSNPSLTAGGTTTVSVTVTAENGATKTYQIKVTRGQDPNYVASNNADLSSLSAGSYALSPAFSPEVTQYYVWLPYEAQEISLSAKTDHRLADFQIGAYEQLVPGAGTNIPVTVTAEDGTEKVYTVTVVRAPEHEKVEDLLARWLEEPEEAPVPEQTEPVPTEPVTQPTEPATEPTKPTEPAPAEPEAPRISGFVWLLFAAGIVIGAGVTALILLLNKKR